jgi:hypothetical protein
MKILEALAWLFILPIATGLIALAAVAGGW